MKVAMCKVCEKYFFTKSTSKAFCSDECKQKEIQRKRDENTQLCWRCKNACGGCSWSKSFIPVEGWDADPVVIKDSEGDIDSYKIKRCPQFIKG